MGVGMTSSASWPMAARSTSSARLLLSMARNLCSGSVLCGESNKRSRLFLTGNRATAVKAQQRLQGHCGKWCGTLYAVVSMLLCHATFLRHVRHLHAECTWNSVTKLKNAFMSRDVPHQSTATLQATDHHIHTPVPSDPNQIRFWHPALLLALQMVVG